MFYQLFRLWETKTEEYMQWDGEVLKFLHRYRCAITNEGEPLGKAAVVYALNRQSTAVVNVVATLTVIFLNLVTLY